MMASRPLTPFASACTHGERECGRLTHSAPRRGFGWIASARLQLALFSFTNPDPMRHFRRPRLVSLAGSLLDWLADLSIAHEARKAARGRRPTLSAELRERELVALDIHTAKLRKEMAKR